MALEEPLAATSRPRSILTQYDSQRHELVWRAATRAARVEIEALSKRAENLQSKAYAGGRLGARVDLEQLAALCEEAFGAAGLGAISSIGEHDRQNATDYLGNFRTMLSGLQNSALRTFDRYASMSFSGSPDDTIPRAGLRMSLRTKEAELIEVFELHFPKSAPIGNDSTTARASSPSYVDRARIDALVSKSGRFDMRRLVALCEELNSAWGAEAFHAVAMLVRAMLDHVPPIFDQPNFKAVVAHYSGARSFKDAMKHLDGQSRAVADGHLHSHIRARESLPTANQVDFRAGIDVLLAEIDRITG